MAKRKKIGIITANIESVYQQRVLSGIFFQCEKYGYDVVSFAPLVHAEHHFQDYLNAENNIFDLINFDLLDGIIVVTISLSDRNPEDSGIRAYIVNRLKKECTKPVISLDLPLGDFETVYTGDRLAFSAITAHILDVHMCRDIYFLTGVHGYKVSEERLGGFIDVMKNRGLPFDMNNVFYGDFWYSGGEALAERIASGELHCPEAVICANDHMAMGLANRLIEHGIDVPGKVLVTGYDATQESVMNTPSITSYMPAVEQAAAEAVNRMRAYMEPEEEIIPVEYHPEKGLCIGGSCGCPENIGYIKDSLFDSLYNVNQNYAQNGIEDRVDIACLTESYMLEELTVAVDPVDCLRKIYMETYLIRPYGDFYLCLTENWLNTDEKLLKGYPEKMKTVIHSKPEDAPDRDKSDLFHSDGNDHIFDTAVMLPDLWEDRDEPSVFYFSPVHFNENTLGYSVLRNPLNMTHKINIVFRNWMRNINNALEMIRMQNRLVAFSQRDAMTGLYNRRGMEKQLERITHDLKGGEVCIAFVVDMDGLKYINDNFGHSEGDYGINAIASAVRRIARSDEICVRAGGDEFYVIGIGDYSGADLTARVQRFNDAVEEEDQSSGKPYEISASIGGCCEHLRFGMTVDDVIHIADGRMYKSKTERKKQRSK